MTHYENIKTHLRLMNLDRSQSIVSSLLLGFALGLRAFPDFILQAVPLIASTVLIYCAGAVLNNVSDAAFDNKENPISAGIVSKRNALGLSALLASAGMLIASFYGLFAMAVGAGMIAAGIFYSYFLRIKDRVWCTLFLAFTHHLTPLVLGYYIVRRVMDAELVAFAVSIYVAIAGIILVKDFKDIERDVREGRRNFAILLGPEKTSRIVLASSLLYLLLVFGLIKIAGIANLLASFLVVASALGIAALSTLLVRRPTPAVGKTLLPYYRKFVSLNFAVWSIALVL